MKEVILFSLPLCHISDNVFCYQESELIALMDQHGIGTDASIPQHIKNVCDRHYVDVCGPTGEDGSRGQVIKVNRGKPGGGRGGHQGQGQQRPTSRHMVPRGLGLAFLGCFEELDKELCEPKIRAYMEEQVINDLNVLFF